MSGIAGCNSGSCVCKLLLSIVKTDLNCLLSKSAFSDGVVTALPSADFSVLCTNNYSCLVFLI